MINYFIFFYFYTFARSVAEDDTMLLFLLSPHILFVLVVVGGSLWSACWLRFFFVEYLNVTILALMFHGTMSLFR